MSLVNDTPKEVAYLCMQRFVARVSIDGDERGLDVSVGHIQVNRFMGGASMYVGHTQVNRFITQLSATAAAPNTHDTPWYNTHDTQHTNFAP